MCSNIWPRITSGFARDWAYLRETTNEPCCVRASIKKGETVPGKPARFQLTGWLP